MSKTTPSSGGHYWPTMLLVVIAMCPGQINSSALGPLSPTIAQSLGVSPTDLTWVTLLGSAATPLGYLIAADLTQRFVARHLALVALGLLVVGSLGCALAPNLPVLLAAHIIQGFAAGLLIVTIIGVPLTGFPASRMPITMAILVLGLFGAGTLGPLVGGLVERMETWRLLFAVNAFLSLVAIPLALAVLAEQPAPDPRAPVDVAALLLAVSGMVLLFIGVGQLSWHDWGTPQVEVPFVLGVGALLALIVVEWVQPAPLLTVHYLVRPRPAAGAVMSWVGVIGYGGLFGLLPQFLEHIRGLGAQDTGLLLWPTTAAAVVGAGLVGLLFTTRWFTALPLGGLFLLAVGAWLLTGLTAFTGDGSIMLVAAVLGVGASVTVTPAMLVAALSAPRQLTRRTLALITLLRYAMQTSVGPFVGYFIGTKTAIHYAHLAEQVTVGSSSGMFLQESTQSLMVHGYTQGQAHALAVQNIIQELTLQGRVLGMNDAAGLLLLVVVLGAAMAVLILLMGRPDPANTKVRSK
jgi:MFS family permease